MTDNLLASKERNSWIDCLKGVAILLVIWGHTQGISPINTWVQTFHVPIFLGISGYLFCEKEKRISSFVSTLKKVGWPYIWFSLFAIVIDAVYAFVFKGSVIESIIIDVYKTVSLYGIMAIWYLPSYAIATYIILKERNKATRRIASIVFIIIAVITDYLFRWINVELDHNLYLIIYYPLSALVRGLLCSSYIAIGYEVHNYLNTKNRLAQGFLCAVSFVLSIGLSTFCVDANLSKLHFGSMAFVFLICSGAGAIAFTSLFYLLQDTVLCKSRFLQYCGANSLLFLITHMTFKLPEVSWKIEEMLFGARGIGIVQNLQGLICLVIILAFEIPILFLLKNTRLKALVVKK